MFLGLGNIYIINIYSITFIINISLLWTNRGQCPHPFTTTNIAYTIKILKCAIYLFSISFVSINNLSKSET